MQRIFCSGRWMCLLILGGVILFPELRGVASVAGYCCPPGGSGTRTNEEIIKCVKQKPKGNCRSKDYLVKVKSGKLSCIRFDSEWMQEQIQAGTVSCREEKF